MNKIIDYVLRNIIVIITVIAYIFLVWFGYSLIKENYPTKIGDLEVAFFGASLGGFLGIGAALLVYQRQAVDARRKEQQDSEKARATEQRAIEQARQAEIQAVQRRRLEHIRWFSGLLEQVVKTANRQAENLDTFAKALEADPTVVHSLQLVASSANDRLARADNEATFHAFDMVFAADPNKNQAYRELLGQTDFIAISFRDIETRFERYRTDLRGRQQAIKYALEQSANLLANLEVSMRPGGPLGAYFRTGFHRDLKEIQQQYNELIATHQFVQVVFDKYVDPLKHLLLAEPHLPGVSELQVLLKNVSVAFTDYQNTSKGYQRSFTAEALRTPTLKLDALRQAIDQNLAGRVVPLPVTAAEPQAASDVAPQPATQ